MTQVRVAGSDDLSPGEMMAVEAEGEELLLARVGDEYFVVNNLCTHADSWLDMGQMLPETCEVRCPLHEGTFNLRTGAATREPATEPIAVYRVTVVNGDVLVEIGEG